MVFVALNKTAPERGTSTALNSYSCIVSLCSACRVLPIQLQCVCSYINTAPHCADTIHPFCVYYNNFCIEILFSFLAFIIILMAVAIVTNCIAVNSMKKSVKH